LPSFQHIQERDKTKTTIHSESFEDFAENSFKVTISKVQQLALSKAGGKLPTPAEQLAMINRRREAKKSRAGQVNHSFTKIFFLYFA